MRVCLANVLMETQEEEGGEGEGGRGVLNRSAVRDTLVANWWRREKRDAGSGEEPTLKGWDDCCFFFNGEAAEYLVKRREGQLEHSTSTSRMVEH